MLVFIRLYRISLLFCLPALLSACITTSTGKAPPPDPERAFNAHLNLGLTYLQKDNREASRRHFEKALSLQPDSADVHNGLGMLYQLTGEADLAEESFLRALKEDANFSQGNVSYGRFLFEQARYEESYNFFEKATRDVSFEQRAIALTYLGQTALKLNRKLKAKALFEQSTNINNKLALPLIELSELYFDEKDYAKAKTNLDEYVEFVGRTAKSLWLGIRIERIFGNKDKEASYALALRNLHPYSQEYLEYKKALENNNNL
ncbi:MAG: type IV pilus assembly protein PilF [Granulosicoccus sp.]|jgi:type IV pilus assembly protein PilF